MKRNAVAVLLALILSLVLAAPSLAAVPTHMTMPLDQIVDDPALSEQVLITGELYGVVAQGQDGGGWCAWANALQQPWAQRYWADNGRQLQSGYSVYIKRQRRVAPWGRPLGEYGRSTHPCGRSRERQQVHPP